MYRNYLMTFTFRNEIFRQNSITVQFVEGTIVALKNKFIAEKDSHLRRSALIFLISKIYFTDDVANQMKLRITSDEWDSFKSFIDDFNNQQQYETTKIMFYHLFTENFFRFTMKNKALALDFGTPDTEKLATTNANHDAMFWKEIRREVEILEKSDLVELKQLNELREESIKPFEQMFPEKRLIAESIADFEMLKNVISEPTDAGSSKITRKEVSQACRDFLIASHNVSTQQEIEIEEIEWDEPSQSSNTPPEDTKRKSRKSTRKAAKDLNSSDSDSDKEFKKMNRSLGYQTQNVMRGIGAATNFSEKLKKCYDKVE